MHQTLRQDLHPRGINFLFGVIIAGVVANFVGSVLGQDGVYESEIERDGNVFYLHHEPPRKLSTLTAEEVRLSTPRPPFSLLPIVCIAPSVFFFAFQNLLQPSRCPP